MPSASTIHQENFICVPPLALFNLTTQWIVRSPAANDSVSSPGAPRPLSLAMWISLINSPEPVIAVGVVVVASRFECSSWNCSLALFAKVACEHDEDHETGGKPGGMVFHLDILRMGYSLKTESGNHATAASVAASERKISRPSLEPSRSSQARSGCGIKPSTLRDDCRCRQCYRASRLDWRFGVTFSVSIAVTKDDSIFSLQVRQALRRRKRSFPRRARSEFAAPIPGFSSFVKGVSVRFDTHVHVFANEMQIAIANQRARQQSCFAKNLKAVADAQHEAAAGGKLLHRFHHRRKPRERAGAQIVAVRKAAGNDHARRTSSDQFRGAR